METRGDEVHVREHRDRVDVATQEEEVYNTIGKLRKRVGRRMGA